MSNKRLSFLQLLALFTKHRKLFIINFLVLSVLTAAYSLVAPKWFTATTTILPPSDDSLINLTSFINDLPGALSGLGIGSTAGNASIYLAILNSRTVMEDIAKKFDLQNRFDEGNLEDTIKMLRLLVSTEINDDGTIKFSVEASTPFLANEAGEDEARQLAADMANYFIECLGRNNTQLKIDRARNNRTYIENRYLQNVADLKKAEETLNQFQKESGTIALPEQTEATIRAAAELQAQIILTEVQAGVLGNTVAKDNPKLTQLHLQLNELRVRFREFLRGPQGNGRTDHDKMELYIPFHDLPDIGIRYVRLLREVKLQETLMEFLLPVYEQAKIEEAKDLPTVQVLDVAIPPVRRTRPKRTIMVLLAGFLSLIVSASIVVSLEFLRSLKDNDSNEYSELVYILNELSRDLKQVRNKVFFRKN